MLSPRVPDLTNAAWRKSSRSDNNGGNCVEVADNVPGLVGVRDSKNPHGGVLAFDPSHWTAFVADVKLGRFDRP